MSDGRTSGTSAPTHLTNGWEPDAEVGDTLVRQCVAAWAERATQSAQHAGRVDRDDDAVMADPGRAWVFDRAAFPLHPMDPDDFRALAARARGFFAPSGRPWILVSPFPTPDLTPEGLELEGHPPLMLHLGGATPLPTPTGLTIREIRDAEDVAAFDRTVVEAFPVAEGGPVLEPALFGDGLRGWIGFVDGQPVATAAAWTAHGVTEVDWISTRPEFRGRGIGEAMTWRATGALPDRPSILLASDPGRSVYERMGYSALLRFTVWGGRGA